MYEENQVSNDESNINFDEMEMFARKFRKFLKFNKDNLKKDFKKFDKSKYDKAKKFLQSIMKILMGTSRIDVMVVRVMAKGQENVPLN